MRCTESAEGCAPRKDIEVRAMPLISLSRRCRVAAVVLVAALALAGCAAPSLHRPVPSSPAPSLAPSPVPSPAPSAARPPASTFPAPPSSPRYIDLGPAAAPRTMAELQLQFARRLVAAHPDTSYTTAAPGRLLAIPVIEVELDAYGHVRRIDVVRKPSTGDAATVLAIAAIRRAAPYGNLSRLPRPWRLTEVFLFDDQLRFKPRTLEH